MTKYIIVKRIKDYEDADFHIVGTSDSKEEAEAQKDLWDRIKAQEDYNFFIFEGEVEKYENAHIS